MFYKKGGGDIWSILTLKDVFFLEKMEKTGVVEEGGLPIPTTLITQN